MTEQRPPYYVNDVRSCVNDYMRHLLVNHSKIPEATLEKHLYTIVRTSKSERLLRSDSSNHTGPCPLDHYRETKYGK